MQLRWKKERIALAIYSIFVVYSAWGGTISSMTNTFTSGSVISSSQVNADFVQLMNAINNHESRIASFENDITALGNGNVGIGTSTPQTTLDVNGVVNRTVPVLAMSISAAQSVPSSTNYVIAFDVTDTTNTPSQTTLITYFPSSGGSGACNYPQFQNTSGRTLVILVTYTISWSSNASGERAVWMSLNTTSTVGNRYGQTMVGANSVADSTSVAGSAIITFGNGSCFSLYGWQTSGSTLSLFYSGIGISQIQIAVL